VFKGYDFKHKRVFAVLNVAVTVLYVTSETIALYCLEQKWTGKAEDVAIVKWNLFSTIIYAALMMEASGTLALSLIFEQFDTEVVNQIKAGKLYSGKKVMELPEVREELPIVEEEKENDVFNIGSG